MRFVCEMAERAQDNTSRHGMTQHALINKEDARYPCLTGFAASPLPPYSRAAGDQRRLFILQNL